MFKISKPRSPRLWVIDRSLRTFIELVDAWARMSAPVHSNIGRVRVSSLVLSSTCTRLDCECAPNTSKFVFNCSCGAVKWNDFAIEIDDWSVKNIFGKFIRSMTCSFTRNKILMNMDGALSKSVLFFEYHMDFTHI